MLHPILSTTFYNRPTLEVATELLGKFLVMKSGVGQKGIMITEVEAYDGFDDLASHASKGRTQRTNVMFGPAGYWYVYLVYGMYFMLNVVTGPEDYPAAVLIRGVSDFTGPGKLTKHLMINKSFNEKPANKLTGLWIEDRGVTDFTIQKTPRIGVSYAGELWAKKPYRFVIKNPKSE